MADSKISALDAWTTPIATDVLPIVDVTAGVTKKITVANLGGGGYPVNATPTANNIPVLDASAKLPTTALYAASDTVAGIMEMAIQSEQETGTDVVRAVSPGRQQYHPSAVKFWVQFVGSSGSISASYNVTSVTDVGVGRSTVNIATDMSSATYGIDIANGFQTGVTSAVIGVIDTDTGVAAGSVPIWTVTVPEALVDVAFVWVSGYGDQ